MELYLVRHGEAKSEQEDPNRPLTERGRNEVVRVAQSATRAGIKINSILHSSKLRAKQTAEILAEHLNPTRGISQKNGLDPMDAPLIAKQMVEDYEGPLMLVGHLPHMSRLTSLLITSDSERAVVAFQMGGIVCLVHDKEGWRIKWMLTPEVIRRRSALSD